MFGFGKAKQNNQQYAELMAKQAMAERMMTESLTDVLANYVDPEDAFLDNDGVRWLRIGGETKAAVAFDSEEALSEIRNKCRDLALTNEYAINGHENRISYVVGSGHEYEIVARGKAEPSEDLLESVQDVLDEFLEMSGWYKIQQEVMLRKDRDGESFLRMFLVNGQIVPRFIEPAQVFTPDSQRNNSSESFGVVTEPGDVGTVLGYWVDGELVDASEIQHRKASVDANVKRGLPLFYPVRRILQNIETVQRNMAVVSAIQASIAYIRKHSTGTQTGVTDWLQTSADVKVKNDTTGKSTYHKHHAPGTIMDVPAGIDFDFPSHRVNPSAFVPVIQSLLRGVASRLVMPEFMLSSDASNANYSSTMVAEGPSVKMFERLQADMIVDDVDIMRRVVGAAVAVGRLPEDTLEQCTIEVQAPRLTVRDRNKEVEADATLVREKIMSKHTARMRNDLDPDSEEEWIAAEREAVDPFGMSFAKQDDDDADADADK